jgi:hypothetical protein
VIEDIDRQPPPVNTFSAHFCKVRVSYDNVLVSFGCDGLGSVQASRFHTAGRRLGSGRFEPLAWGRGRSMSSTGREGWIADLRQPPGERLGRAGNSHSRIATEPRALTLSRHLAQDFYTVYPVELSGRGQRAKSLNLRRGWAPTATPHRPIMVINPGDTPARPTSRSGLRETASGPGIS